ncbi:hypothetical protein A7A76_23325 [Lysobacter enzymogenes]|uniref:McrB family protein n=1 Tax=Lysobacter enzymogenes TaxID=69 RepID=UPI0019D001C6|nr:hypothetical protein [Lysobacter enzymogenes]MBN7137634.1 hypothetical protein [Lysobacter enzymogenes]
MNLVERQRQFLEATTKHFGTSRGRPRELFGVSNSAKIVEGGIQLGVVNLENVKDDTEGLILGCVLRFPPEDEVYFAVYIRKDKVSLVQRLADMKRLGAASKDAVKKDSEQETDFSLEPAETTDTLEDNSDITIKYNNRNHLVAVYLAADGRLWLRNAGFWGSLKFDLSPFGPGVEPDQVAVALYPPSASARRSLLAREFVGWLGSLVGHEKIHELPVWADTAALGPMMRRSPATVSIDEIENSIEKLGGHYRNKEVRRLHAALNFLDHKHFVILAGLSGTGKTQLALKYARAVHGVTSDKDPDPLIFECPVRPEWTDPTSLTGYYDVLSNRYMVPTFLDAVLVATAHRDSPVFVILDEMNLARIEYYLSDVLSVIETRGALQLHSNSVPLEGSNGTNVRAEIPIPPNLYIIGTINVDETTNPVSDKVLDRASVIDMSTVDAASFIDFLAVRHPELQASSTAFAPKLIEVHRLMQQHGRGFGYRLIEEFVRYHAFDAKHLGNAPDSVTDDLLVQKVFVKLRGAERQRGLLNSLDKACDRLPRAKAYIQRLISDLDEFGSFQAMR